MYGLTAASDSSYGQGNVAPLRDQLVNGLRATRPEEIAFIDRVVAFVAEDALELSTVNAAFKWARKRRPSYPYPFFERAIRVLAAREGVTL
jgi:hypothetical protein